MGNDKKIINSLEDFAADVNEIADLWQRIRWNKMPFEDRVRHSNNLQMKLQMWRGDLKRLLTLDQEQINLPVFEGLIQYLNYYIGTYSEVAWMKFVDAATGMDRFLIRFYAKPADQRYIANFGMAKAYFKKMQRRSLEIRSYTRSGLLAMLELIVQEKLLGNGIGDVLLSSLEFKRQIRSVQNAVALIPGLLESIEALEIHFNLNQLPIGEQ